MFQKVSIILAVFYSSLSSRLVQRLACYAWQFDVCCMTWFHSKFSAIKEAFYLFFIFETPTPNHCLCNHLDKREMSNDLATYPSGFFINNCYLNEVASDAPNELIAKM